MNKKAWKRFEKWAEGLVQEIRNAAEDDEDWAVFEEEIQTELRAIRESVKEEWDAE